MSQRYGGFLKIESLSKEKKEEQMGLINYAFSHERVMMK